jgi:hypothetical protein
MTAIRRKKSAYEARRAEKSVGSNFGSNRFARTTQIYVVQGGLLDGKITTIRCLLAFISAVFLAVLCLLSSQSTSLANY